MSVLREIRGIILRGLVNEDNEIKERVLDLFDIVDSDLDDAEYQQSSNVDQAVGALNEALIKYSVQIDEPESTSSEVGSVPSVMDDDENDDGN